MKRRQYWTAYRCTMRNGIIFMVLSVSAAATSSARNYLDRAVSMEPGNAEYRRARDS